jgi:hypothetical protein
MLVSTSAVVDSGLRFRKAVESFPAVEDDGILPMNNLLVRPTLTLSPVKIQKKCRRIVSDHYYLLLSLQRDQGRTPRSTETGDQLNGQKIRRLLCYGSRCRNNKI